MRIANATVLFCDDVRQELNGKFTIVGLYQGFLGLQVSPTQLPRFVALALVELPTSYAGQVMQVQLWDRESALLKATVELAKQFEPQSRDADVLRITMPVEMTPLVVSVDMRLRLSISVGDWIYQSPELPVILASAVGPSAQL